MFIPKLPLWADFSFLNIEYVPTISPESVQRPLRRYHPHRNYVTVPELFVIDLVIFTRIRVSDIL